MACRAVVAECISESASQGGVKLLHAEQSAALLISQLDRTQIATISTLQLLRHAATDGDTGTLTVVHENDWPEVRMVSRPTHRHVSLSTLPIAQSPTHPQSHLLDYRCHVPGGALRTQFARPLRSCLLALALGGSSTEGLHALNSDEMKSRRLLDITLGSTTPSSREAVGRRARLLLDRGMERTVQSVLHGRNLTARCCSLTACVRASAIGESPADVLRRGDPAAPSATPFMDTSRMQGAPHHPLPLNLLQSPWGARSSDSGSTWSATRDSHAFVAHAAAASLQDASALLPSHFDARYKNPCWECHGTLCCLPFGHILGVSKCGTTDLFGRLSQHPSVLPSANKGPHFWDEPHPFRWYVDLYAQGAQRMHAGHAAADSVFIDASSNTLTYAGVGVRGERHPKARALLPQVLGWLQPNARLIVMLREPSERYYSAYWYYDRRYRIYSRRFGRTSAAAFASMVASDIDTFTRCRAASTARRCARSTFYAAEQLIKGMYALFLEPWLATFPSTQLLVLRLEDYRDAPVLHMRRILSFLSLPKPDLRTWRRMVSRPRANRRAPGGEPMHDDTQRLLVSFYADHNEHLAVMMGDERYLQWNRPKPASNGSKHAPW